MKNVKLANRYANALYEFSLEKDSIEAVYQDTLFILNILKNSRELNSVMESPVIPNSKKSKVFVAIFEKYVSEITFRFLKLVLEKKREPALLLILEEFVKYYYRFHNIKIVDFTTAQPISEVVMEKVRLMIQEKTGAIVEMKPIFKPEVIGGFIIKVDDFVFDNTILNDIHTLKREFSHNIYRAGF